MWPKVLPVQERQSLWVQRSEPWRNVSVCETPGLMPQPALPLPGLLWVGSACGQRQVVVATAWTWGRPEAPLQPALPPVPSLLWLLPEGSRCGPQERPQHQPGLGGERHLGIQTPGCSWVRAVGLQYSGSLARSVGEVRVW